MSDFALDPALFGVAGPSHSATGRVRNIPAQVVQPREVEEESESGSDSSSGYTSSGSGSGTDSDSESGSTEDEDEEDEEDESSQNEDRYTSIQKGKGRAAPVERELDDSGGEGDSLPKNDEVELGRLISAIRDTGPTLPDSGRGLLGKEWDRTMEQELEELEQEEANERGPSGQMRRKKDKRGKGRRPFEDMEPSLEISQMLGQANVAYIMHGDTTKAIEILTEVIRIEPNTKTAWLTLSTIQRELGNREKAVQLQIVGTHLTKASSGTWREIGQESKEMGLLEQAIYCFGQAIKSDKTDIEAHWDRAVLLRETGKIRLSINSFLAILKQQPHNPNILREIGPMYYDLGDVKPAIELFQSAYEHYKASVPIPRSSAQIQSFGSADLELLSDFHRSLKNYTEAVRVIRDGQRYLQGRGGEDEVWRDLDDDREYDQERQRRPDWQTHSRLQLESSPTYPLEIGFRLRLGLCRLYDGRVDEAKLHFSIIRTEHAVIDHPGFWGEMADAYFDKKLFDEALEVFIEMTECDESNVSAVWIKIAQCHKHLGSLNEASICYQAVVDSDPDDLDSKLALADIFDTLGKRTEALALVNEVLDERRIQRQTQQGLDDQQGMDAPGDADNNQSGSGRDSGSSALGTDDEAGLTVAGKRKKSKRKLGGRSHRLGEHAGFRFRAPKNPKRPLRRSEMLAERRRQYRAYRIATLKEMVEEDQEIQMLFNETFEKLQQLDLEMERHGQEKRVEEGETPTAWIDADLLQEWLELVAFLIDTYRTTRALFPSDGKKKFTGVFPSNAGGMKGLDEQASELANRIQASIAEEQGNNDEPDANVQNDAYRGISFDQWARLAVRYAFMLTVVNERNEAQEVLRHMLTSSAMKQEGDRMQFLVFGLISCALHEQDYEAALEDLRKIIASRRSEGEPLRIMQAICGSGLSALDAFLNTKFQKYLLRQIKYIDEKAMPALKGGAEGVDEDDDDPPDEGETTLANAESSTAMFKPTKVNPVFLMLYGHIMAAGKSYQPAIVYYLRAYEMQPDDPLICLTLALAYAHRAMQRQTDNRHLQITQAIAFLDRYSKTRANEQEVQYNLARVFHQLALVDLAVKHYENVLIIADERKERLDQMQVDGREPWQEEGGSELDLSKEAAYNLSLIYFTKNAPELARAVTEKYLSL